MAYSQEYIDELIKAQDDFVWETDAWDHHERTPRWYLAMGVVTLVMLVYSVATGNFLFAFLILLIAIVLVLAGNRDPETMLVQIGQNGVVVNGHFYEYKDLSHFSIIYHPPETKLLYLYTRDYIKPRMRLRLQDENPIEIREHLKKYVDENAALQEEHLSDILARLLKL